MLYRVGLDAALGRSGALLVSGIGIGRVVEGLVFSGRPMDV
jgi:hypothetical protein